MRVPLRFHEAAECELDAAADYYRSVSVGLAVAFASEVERALTLILEHPGVGKQAAPSVRMVVMRGFPYSVVYKVLESETLVLAVGHHRRRPGYWLERSE